MTIAIYAGSFDPPTQGHLWMIQQASKIFNELIVAIANNPDKKYTFSIEDRLRMMNSIVEKGFNQSWSFNRTHLRIMPPGAFLAKWAHEREVTHLVRGIRSVTDFEYERSMRHVNSDLAPLVQTVFFIPPRELSEVSSSLVRGMVGLDDWYDIVTPLVPPEVMPYLVNLQERK